MHEVDTRLFGDVAIVTGPPTACSIASGHGFGAGTSSQVVRLRTRGAKDKWSGEKRGWASRQYAR
jgi:hypothetical protein